MLAVGCDVCVALVIEYFVNCSDLACDAGCPVCAMIVGVCVCR